jgi:2-polyprenyl-3-methyl-5-hydroxy-6-metoxy-1,4-benzoquinol methylase
MPNLRDRVRVPELMDDPALDPKRHAHALAGLRRVNVISRSDAILWSELRPLAQRLAPQPLRVLDIATGSGDVPLRLAARFANARLPVQISACDISPTAIAQAQAAAHATNVPIHFFTHDVLAHPLPDEYDAVVCSLFLHHLDPPEAQTILQRMAAASRHIVLVNDLQRSWLGWWAAYIGTRVLTRSPIVHYDGPVSVAAAFTPNEAIQLAAKAGLAHATATRRFPWRFLLKWERSPG